MDSVEGDMERFMVITEQRYSHVYTQAHTHTHMYTLTIVYLPWNC